jgi:hypothetical protein
MILSLLLPLLAHACSFPENSKITAAADTGNYQVALAEEKSQCLYFVRAEKNEIFASLKLTESPSDIQWHAHSRRLFFYLTGAAELRSFAPGEKESRLEAKFEPRRHCETTEAAGVRMENCREIKSSPYKILLGKNELLLSYGNTVLAARLGEYNFRPVADGNWYFGVQIKYDAESNVALALQNYPSGESMVYWYILNQKNQLLAPVPTQSLLSSDITNVYFLNRNYFLANTGLVYRLSDFALVANLGSPFEEAFFAEEKIAAVSAADTLFKATIYNSNLRPVSFEYFSVRPLFITAGPNESLLYVFPEGKLTDSLRLLPLRKIP